MHSVERTVGIALIHCLLLKTVRVVILWVFYSDWELPVTEFFGTEKAVESIQAFEWIL